MAIFSQIIELPIQSKYQVEESLKSLGYDVLRWAIVKVDKSSITVSFSYVKNL